MNIHEQPPVSFGLFPLKATEANDKEDENCIQIKKAGNEAPEIDASTSKRGKSNFLPSYGLGLLFA